MIGDKPHVLKGYHKRHAMKQLLLEVQNEELILIKGIFIKSFGSQYPRTFSCNCSFITFCSDISFQLKIMGETNSKVFICQMSFTGCNHVIFLDKEATLPIKYNNKALHLVHDV